MPQTLEQLRIFLAVGEREHVTRAAAALHLTQSAISSAIAALESRHGTALFERVGRGIRLTEAGRQFLPEARAVLDRAAAAERVLKDVADLSRGRLKIVASQTLANHWLPPALVQFRRAHPGIDLDLAVGNTGQVAREVLAMHVDLGFAEGEIEGDAGLLAEPVGADEVFLLVAAGHPWARTSPGPESMRVAPWVRREIGSGTRARMDAALSDFGVDPDALRDVLDLPSNEAVLAAVAAGGGATLISNLAALAELRAGRVERVAFPVTARRFLLVRHPDRYQTAAGRAFVALLRARDPG